MTIPTSINCVAAGDDSRIFASWRIPHEADANSGGYNEIYYFYPDGIFVRQLTMRREFVDTGHWKWDKQKHLVLYDWQSPYVTLSTEERAALKKEKRYYTVVFTSDTIMQWTPDKKDAPSITLTRSGDLPDRTKNPYWPFWTDKIETSK